MMKLLFVLCLALTQLAHAVDFEDAMRGYGLGALNEHAYCIEQNQQVSGFQVDKLQRIASLTKIFSTLYTSETQDLHRTFQTKITISGDRIHISGGRDPYFEEEKMLLLMQALNSKGYKQFKTLTFDEDFLFYDLALSEHADITTTMTQSRLRYYLNPQNAKTQKPIWQSVLNFSEEENVTIADRRLPSLKVITVAYSKTNPLKDLPSTTFTHTSKPFHALLKAMNVMSKNLVSQNVFLESQRVTPLGNFLNSINLSAQELQVRNGSGLPMISGRARFDNLATCRVMLTLVKRLQTSLKKHKLGLLDVMAINGGQDLGSFRQRFNAYPETHQAVISKTGTIKNASTLSGFLSVDELVPFAILNQTANTTSARRFQDKFVALLFADLGGPKPLIYTKLSTFPWTDADFLAEIGE